MNKIISIAFTLFVHITFFFAFEAGAIFHCVKHRKPYFAFRKDAKEKAKGLRNVALAMICVKYGRPTLAPFKIK